MGKRLGQGSDYFSYDSLVASSRAVAPAANAALAAVTVVAGATYEVDVTAATGGTLAAIDTGNLRLKRSTTGDVCDINIDQLGGTIHLHIPRLTMNAGDTVLSCYPPVTSTASSVYSVTIVATRVK
jgi:hypothetical protein